MRPNDHEPASNPTADMDRFVSDIALIYDNAVKVDDIASLLAGCFSVQKESLENYVENSALKANLYIYFTNPKVAATHKLLKKAIANCEGAKIFVLPAHSSDSIDRLRDLGIEDYLSLPIDPDELHSLAKIAINRQVERSWSMLEPTKKNTLTTSLKCFDECFMQLRLGQPLPMEDIEASCNQIRETAALGGLNQWIDALDRHHNYSFRHSMFVCGSLTYFAHAIGIRGADLELLAIGGMLHDIGKSNVPEKILDKPGKLDEVEWEHMRKHPVYSREIFLREQNMDKTIVSMAVGHHEKLNGTGYPDGLSGPEIDDYMRMTAIADVYSALIDKRAYKGAMSNVEALDMMEKFQGHLDMDLLRVFKSFVLDQSDLP